MCSCFPAFTVDGEELFAGQVNLWCFEIQRFFLRILCFLVNDLCNFDELKVQSYKRMIAPRCYVHCSYAYSHPPANDTPPSFDTLLIS